MTPEKLQAFPDAPGSEKREILVIRLKSLGDLVLSTVIPAALTKLWPGAQVDYLVDPAFAGVVGPFAGVRRELVRPAGWSARLAQLGAITRRYDLVMDLHGSAAAALTARAASRGLVIGWAGKRLSRLYTVAVIDENPARHTLEVNLDMVRSLGLPDSGPPELVGPRDAAREAPWLKRIHAPAALIHPGARFPAKAWPAARFREVAGELVKRGFRPYILAGPGEEIPKELSEFEAISDVPAGDLVFMLRSFEVFVGNDSGPMHAAAAAGCRVVGVFGPSNPHRWRPWGARSLVVSEDCACGAGWKGTCRAGDAWCLGQVPVARVIQALEQLLA